MTLGSKEHFEMLEAFENACKSESMGHIRVRLDKEIKDNWKNGYIYQDGLTNNLFRVFSIGYATARVKYMS